MLDELTGRWATMIVQERQSAESGELYANLDIEEPRLSAQCSDVQQCTFLFLILKSNFGVSQHPCHTVGAVAQGLLQLACERLPPRSTPPSLAYCVSILRTTQRTPTSRRHKFTPSPSFEDGALLKPQSVELTALERANPRLRDAALTCGTGPIRRLASRSRDVARGWTQNVSGLSSVRANSQHTEMNTSPPKNV
jgi:hypothetical protein